MNSTQISSAKEGLLDANLSDGVFLETFRQPTAALRGKPFWCWNGELEEEELLRQLDIIQEMGMGGFFIHSRNGLKTEYLGEDWFRMINACIDKCSSSDLKAWIYDEDRWPSGTAGGMATRNPAYRMRSIVMDVTEPGELINWPDQSDFIEAHLARLNGLVLENYQQLPYEELQRPPGNTHVLVFRREIHPSHPFYNGASYLNTLDREATDAFLGITHEKYREQCGGEFGRGIQGIFTDEPHRGFILCDAVSQPGSSQSSHAIPYTEVLFSEFESRFGQCLRGRLPELYYRYRGERLSRLKWCYIELLQQLFMENWARPCLRWCEENDLHLTGHVLHEDSLTAQVVPCGSVMRYYEHMSYPGIDVLSRNCQAYWGAKQAVSVARQQGQPLVLSELYGCTGWEMGFDGHKQIGDWQAFLGINLRCHHLSWYTMGGEAKRDYPASILHQSSWYSQYRYIEDYFSRINFVLQQGRPDCDTLVIHPVESLWAQFHLGWATWLKSNSEDVDRIENRFSTLFTWLVDSQLDFDYGDEEQLARLGGIEVIDDEVFFSLGQMRYRTLVIGGMETIRESTLEHLREFASAGGKVIFAGEPPTYVDAIPSDAAGIFANEIGVIPWEKEAIVSSIREKSESQLSVNDGRGVEGVIAQVRLVEDGDLYVALVNTTHNNLRDVKLEVKTIGALERLNCRDGSVCPVEVKMDSEGLHWQVDFAALEEHVYRIKANVFDDVSACRNCDTAIYDSHVELTGPFRYRLSEPNALPLDRARYRLGSADWSGTEDILRIDQAVRDHLEWPHRSGDMIQPWCNHQGVRRGKPIILEYSFEIASLPNRMELLVEQPERWCFYVNGSRLEVPVEPAWRIDIAFKCLPLDPKTLKTGKNVLRMTSMLRPDTDLEAIYLIGDFGVYCEEDSYHIGDLPSTLKVGDIVEQGLPFYTGIVNYQCDLPAGVSGDGAVLELPDIGGACTVISTDEDASLVAFPPYRSQLNTSGTSGFELSVYLTRRNLFGPLHRYPLTEDVTSPASFRTNGDNYRKVYQLCPSGLLETPILSFLPAE